MLHHSSLSSIRSTTPELEAMVPCRCIAPSKLAAVRLSQPPMRSPLRSLTRAASGRRCARGWRRAPRRWRTAAGAPGGGARGWRWWARIGGCAWGRLRALESSGAAAQEAGGWSGPARPFGVPVNFLKYCNCWLSWLRMLHLHEFNVSWIWIDVTWNDTMMFQ